MKRATEFFIPLSVLVVFLAGFALLLLDPWLFLIGCIALGILGTGAWIVFDAFASALTTHPKRGNGLLLLLIGLVFGVWLDGDDCE